MDLQNVFIFLFFKDCSSQHDFRNFKNNGYVFHILTDYSFAVDCGSNSSTRGSDNTIYEAEPTNLGDASYYVTSQTRWGVSNVGKFSLASNGMNIISSSEHFQNAVNSRLFETARMSPSSLRYYGLGLENGNYTILLQFAEVAYPDSQTWQSLGRRVFDIYIQVQIESVSCSNLFTNFFSLSKDIVDICIGLFKRKGF